MRRSLTLLVLACVVGASAVAETDVLHDSIWATVDPAGGYPQVLLDPEGRTRWDLTGIRLDSGRYRKAILDPGSSTLILETKAVAAAGQTALPSRKVDYRDRDGSKAAARWLLPHREPNFADPRFAKPLRLDRGGVAIDVDARRVGLGWVFLPTGPHEVVLQRAWLKTAPTSAGTETTKAQGHGTLMHRWIDPRRGEVARVWGPASADGRRRLSIAGAEVSTELLQGATPMKIYVDQIDGVPCSGPPDTCRSRLAYGYDLPKTCSGDGTACIDASTCGILQECLAPLSTTSDPSYDDMTSMIAATNWNFSPVDASVASAVIASTFAPVNAEETCNFGKCGFNAGLLMTREDKFGIATESTSSTLSIQERTEPVEGPATLWMRAAARNEGIAGGLGTGESRLCYDPNEGMTEVPLYEFAHQDADGWFMQQGDSSTSGAFECEQNIFNHVCPSNCDDVALCRIYTSSCADYSGTQFNDVVTEGPVTLPSGHTFQSLVGRTTSEFCAYPNDPGCTSIFASRVRTIIYLWQVPYLGTVARLVSPQDGPSDLVSFSTVAEADIKFGLFPPVSVSAVGIADDQLEVSWDPGLDTSRIDGYTLYWDNQSGMDGTYANQMTVPAAAGTTATLGGLEPGVEYFVTVTSLSDYQNPSTGVTTTYESLMFPMTIETGSGSMLPAEASASTTCTSAAPPVEVMELTVDKAAGTDLELCWEPSTSSCVDGYQILGATSPESTDNFSVLVADTGPVSCHTLIAPTDNFFLVRAKGPGGVGPLGR